MSDYLRYQLNEAADACDRVASDSESSQSVYSALLAIRNALCALANEIDKVALEAKP